MQRACVDLWDLDITWLKLKGDVSSNLHQLQKTAGKLAKAKKSRELHRSRANYAKKQVQKSTLETANSI